MRLKDIIDFDFRGGIMKKYKVVMCDLDNTLLDYGKDVSLDSIEIIEKLTLEGIEFIPATGRYLGVIPKLILDNKSINYVVSSNGAVISERNDLKTIHECYIDIEKVKDLLVLAYDLEGRIILDTNQGIIVGRRVGEFLKSAKEDYYQHLKQHMIFKDHILEVFDMKDLRIRKIDLGFDNLEHRNIIYDKYKDSEIINVVSSSDANIEVTSLEASKGNALDFIAKHLNISTDEILAIGDSDNDISMLEKAGLSIAMGNASEHVKSHTDDITLHVSENGFAYAMNKYFKLT